MIHASDHASRSALRKHLRKMRRSLCPADQKRAAQRLLRHIWPLILHSRTHRVGVYMAADGEIDPSLLARTCLQRHISIFVPCLRKYPRHTLHFCQISSETIWQKGRFGLLQPVRGTIAPVWSLGLLCVPMVGFDAEGHRLGMGGGFYDRKLAYRRHQIKLRGPFLAGLAHQCQQVDRLTSQSWDISMDWIITDQQTLNCKTKA